MTLSLPIIEDSAWIDIGALEEIPRRGSRRVRTREGVFAVFRTGDDQVFALKDQCPHKQGPLADGMVCGHAVACPLHNWLIDLNTGEPLGADAGKGGVPTAAVALEAGRVFIAARR
jgi:nitrite reductase (NADH) small subunit